MEGMEAVAVGKDLPYFPFYPKDFAADGKVEAMTTLEVGAYMLLLCKAWHETPPCSVPDDDSVLARWARLTESEWSQARTRIRACWQLRDGRLYQPRLEAEYRKVREKGNKSSKAAVTRWEKEREREQLMRMQCVRIADAMPTQCHSESESDTEKDNPPSPPLPRDVPEGATLGGGEEDRRVSVLTSILMPSVGSAASSLARMYPGTDPHYAEWLATEAKKPGINKPYFYVKTGLERKYPQYTGPKQPEKKIRYGAWT